MPRTQKFVVTLGLVSGHCDIFRRCMGDTGLCRSTPASSTRIVSMQISSRHISSDNQIFSSLRCKFNCGRLVVSKFQL
ncbi:hypothetical protein BDR04DRAFT_419495 [Suillus decipiens]|nr:hypothetical protein BDR04DRAFT_419495 [Suillus decipiens]